MIRNLLPLATLIAIIGVAAWLRAPDLRQRPMHNDEAVNTVKFDDLTKGKFKYDPHEYHGPTLYYITWPFVKLSGAKDFASSTETPYRAVPLVFCLLLIAMSAALWREFGWPAIVASALLLAVSPMFVFYSRYYIHEMLLIAFTFAAIISGWKWWTTGRWSAVIALGVSTGLMFATKETWVLPMAAMVGALGATMAWRRLRDGTWLKVERWTLNVDRSVPVFQLLAAAAISLLTATLLFTNFLTHPRGILDAFLAYKIYLTRAADESHRHPFNWYLSLLWFKQRGRGPAFSEAPILILASIGALTAIGRRADRCSWVPVARFITFYTLFLTLAYSILKYKTPWCALGFHHGMILLAGYGLVGLCGIFHQRWLTHAHHAAILALLITLSVILYKQTRTAQLPRWAASPDNPWVYAHTSTDIFTLVTRMDEIVAVAPAGRAVHIQVVTADCWPLPWYLRTFNKVGFFPAPPAALNADIIIGDEKVWDRLEADETRKYIPTSFGLRPGVVLWMYVREPIWDELRKKWAAAPRTR